MAVFEGKKTSDEFIINDSTSDDEVVASDVPPLYLFQVFHGLQADRWTYGLTDGRIDEPIIYQMDGQLLGWTDS